MDNTIFAFRRASAMDGDDLDNGANSLRSLGLDLMERGIHLENPRHLAEAKVVLDEAVEINPHVAWGYSCLGRVRHQLGQYFLDLEYIGLCRQGYQEARQTVPIQLL